MRFSPQDKLAMHPQLAEHMAGKRVYPVGIEISPSGVCQATCEMCFYAKGELGGFRKVFLGISELRGVLRQARDLGVKAITWTGGGDPSLHPQIDDAVEFCSCCGLDQGMFTNALAMPRFDPSLLQWIRVTMTDKPYKPECIRALRPCKTLGFAFNYRGAKEDAYLLETLKLAEDVGANYVQVRPALAFHGAVVDIKPPDFTHPLMQVTGYKFEEARKKHPYKRCEGYHFVPFIFEDGSVNVCAYMRKHGPEFVLGNIYKDSLKDILDRAPSFVPVHEQCQVACKLNEINVMVDRLRRLEDIHFP